MLLSVVPARTYAGHPPIPQKNVIRIAGKDRFETAKKVIVMIILSWKHFFVD